MTTQQPHIGERIRVNFNLHRLTWTYARQIRNARGQLTWRKIGETDSLTLDNCATVTHDNGKIASGQSSRNVIAWIVGDWAQNLEPDFVNDTGDGIVADAIAVRYHPKRSRFFHHNAADPIGTKWTGGKGHTVHFSPTPYVPNRPKGTGATCHLIR